MISVVERVKSFVGVFCLDRLRSSLYYINMGMKGIDIGVESCIACRGFSGPRKKTETNINGTSLNTLRNDIVVANEAFVVA